MGMRNLCLVWLGMSCCSMYGWGAEKGQPNIVLMMSDDQGWGDVGYNGHKELKTPVLDEMARTGLRFDQFYAAAPVCSPTRGSVLTGRHPNRFGCFSWGYTLRPQEVTIGEGLLGVGYRTGHFGKWHLGPLTGNSTISPSAKGFEEWLSSPNFYENNPWMSHKGKPVQVQGESSMVAVDAAIQLIREAVKQEKPFFTVVWFGSPHAPYVAAEDELGLYQGLEVSQQAKHYYGEITGIDRAVGKLRKELRDLKVAENTLVWYTSDNGAMGPGSTGGLSGKKGTLWEGGIRVPCIIEWPAVIKQPRTTPMACSTVDILPTLFDLVGVELPTRPLDGMSLKPLLDGELKQRSKPLGFWVYPTAGHPVRSTEILKAMASSLEAGVEKDTHFPADPGSLAKQYDTTQLPGHAAWLDAPYKLHRIPEGKEFKYQLFDLSQDVQEKKDISETEGKRLEKMKQELEEWQKSVVNSLNGVDYAK